MMSRYQVEVTITSAKISNTSTGATTLSTPTPLSWSTPTLSPLLTVVPSPFWDHRLLLPFDTPIHESTLHIDIVHAHAADDTKLLIGSVRLPLTNVVDVDLGPIAVPPSRSTSKRPSGCPQWKVDVSVSLLETGYHALDPYYAPP